LPISCRIPLPPCEVLVNTAPVHAESEAEQKRIQADAVQKARSKQVSVRSSSPMSSTTNNGAKDRRAMLEEAFDQYGSQV